MLKEVEERKLEQGDGNLDAGNVQQLASWWQCPLQSRLSVR